MQVFIRRDQLESIYFENDVSVEEIEDELELSECEYLALGGRAVTDDMLKNGVTLDVLTRLPGGKVHGSLARAGKVRNQTPKVEKQEKPKKKTGRAKRRHQYIKRFVNVVITPGKKRGPNARS